MQLEETHKMAKQDKIVLVGMGNPLLDMIAVTPTSFLQKYDLKSNDAILAEDKHMGMYEELEKIDTVKYVPGGSTQNSIRVAAALFDAVDGRRQVSAMTGCIGKDSRGTQLRDLLVTAGVVPMYAESDKNPTGLCGVAVTGHERSQVTALGAASDFPKDHVTSFAPLKDALAAADVVYSAGFFLTTCPEAMKKQSEEMMSATNGKRLFCTNLSAMFLVTFFKEQMMSVLAASHYVFGSDLEFDEFAKVHELPDADRGAVAQHIADLPRHVAGASRVVVCTQGSDETLVAESGKTELRRFPVKKIDASAICDTTGAGDAFAGGFLFALCRGAPLEQCVEIGHLAAREVIQRDGCTFEFGDGKAVKEMLK